MINADLVDYVNFSAFICKNSPLITCDFLLRNNSIIEDEQEDTNLSDTAKMEAHDIMVYSGKIKSFDGIKDPVAWQREVRSEWDREWEK